MEDPKKFSQPGQRMLKGKCLSEFDAHVQSCDFCLKNNTGWNRHSFSEVSIRKLMDTVKDSNEIQSILKRLQSRNVAVDRRVVLRNAVRTRNAVIFTQMLQECKSEAWMTDTTKYDLVREILALASTQPADEVLKFLKIIQNEIGAKVEGPHINTLLSAVTETGKSILRYLVDTQGLTLNQEHIDSALLRNNLTTFKTLHEEFNVPIQPYHVHQAVESISVAMTRYLISVGARHNVDDLLRTLRDAWRDSDMIADRRYNDPIAMEDDMLELRGYLRSLKGITPENDRKHLRTILNLFENHKSEMQISDYLEICAYLKRLHDETLYDDGGL